MLKKSIVFIVKLALVVGLFAFLISRSLGGDAFLKLDFRSFRYSFLILGFLLNLTATTITIIRWRALARALGAPLSLRDALNFGFVGYMFNLSPVGIVGGDAIKVVLLAKKKHFRPDAATASVLVDRVLGLYSMFVLGLAFVVATGFYARPEPLARLATQGLTALTVALTFFLALVVTPSSDKSWRTRLAAKVPFVGGALEKLTSATLLYRNKKRVLFGAFMATFAVHALFSASLFCFARGLYGAVPNLVDHFLLYCVGNVGSVVPLSAGPFEYILDELYPLFSIAESICFSRGYGLTIGFAYRLATVGVAAIGVGCYLFERKSVRDAKLVENDKT